MHAYCGARRSCFFSRQRISSSLRLCSFPTAAAEAAASASMEAAAEEEGEEHQLACMDLETHLTRDLELPRLRLYLEAPKPARRASC